MYDLIPGRKSLLALALSTPVLLAGCGGGESAADGITAGDTAKASQTADESNGVKTTIADDGGSAETTSVCGHDSPFQLVGTIPEPNSNDFALNGSIAFIFNAAIDPESVDSSTVAFDGDGALEIRVAGNQIVIDPKDYLDPNTDYQAVIQGIVADCAANAGVPLPEGSTLPFTTGDSTDDSPLAINYAFPTNGDDLVDPREPIVIQFSGALDPSGINGGSLYLQQVNDPSKTMGGEVFFDASNSQMTFLPDMPLDPQTLYEMVLGGQDLGNPEGALSGLTDNPIAEQFMSLFRTGGGSMAPIDENTLSQLPDLATNLQTLASQLQDQFGAFGSLPGMDGFENPLLLTLPLIGNLPDASPSPDNTDTLIAICDPAAADGACALALDISVDPSGMEALMAAFETQDPNQAVTTVVALLGQLADPTSLSAPFSAEALLAEPGFTDLFPAPLSDGLLMAVDQIAAALNQLPLVSDLLVTDNGTLLQAALFNNGSLLSIGGDELDLFNALPLDALTNGQDLATGELPALGDLQSLLSGGDSLPVIGSFLTGDLPGGLITGGTLSELMALTDPTAFDPNTQIEQILGNQAIPTSLTGLPVLGDLQGTLEGLLDGLFGGLLGG